jgi:serine/threonine-protein kinase
VTIPKVAGLTEREALARLVEVLLQPRSEPQPSASVPEGTVIGTDPAAGARVDQGDPVTVLVSSGSEEGQGDKVPDVVGLTVDDAKRILVDAGFGIGATPTTPSDKPPGTVLSQEPQGGSRAERGTLFTLTIAGSG